MATRTWSSAGTGRSSACSWRSPPAKCDFLSHVAGNGRRQGARPSPFDARDGPRDGRRRRQGHGGAAGAVRGHGRGARAQGAGDRPAVPTPWRATPRAMGAIVGSSAPIRQARRKTGQQEGAGGPWGGNTGGGGHRGENGVVPDGRRLERKAYFFTYQFFNLTLDGILTAKTCFYPPLTHTSIEAEFFWLYFEYSHFGVKFTSPKVI